MLFAVFRLFVRLSMVIVSMSICGGSVNYKSKDQIKSNLFVNVSFCDYKRRNKATLVRYIVNYWFSAIYGGHIIVIMCPFFVFLLSFFRRVHPLLTTLGSPTDLSPRFFNFYFQFFKNSFWFFNFCEFSVGYWKSYTEKVRNRSLFESLINKGFIFAQCRVWTINSTPI